MASFASKWSKGSNSLNNAVAKSAVGRYFKLDGSGHPLAREGSVFTRELRAGLVTFTAMAYIISVNASILSDSGGPCVAKVGVANEAAYATCKEQLRQDYVTATSAISFIATFLMGLLANLPLGLAPGLGVNAYFAYTIVGFDGSGLIPYGQALAAVFLEGWIFFALSVFGLRQWLGRLMPRSLTLATGAGIGMFLAFIGIGPNGIGAIGGDAANLVGLGGCLPQYQDENGFCTSHVLQNPTLWLGILLGGILTGLLLIYQVRGAFFWPILLVAIASWPRNSSVSLFPHTGTGDQGWAFFKQVATWHSFSHLGPSNISFEYGRGHVWLALISFLYIDILDTTGTLYSMSRHAGLLDEVITQDFEGSSVAYLVDAVCISMGSLMGLSPATAFVESASGIAEGGRTGLTGIMTSFMFFLSLFFAPIFASIPSYATGSTLIIVGSMMMKSAAAINWEYPGDAIPAFLIIAGIPFTFNIAYGLIAGIVSWIILHNVPLVLGKLHPSLVPPGWDSVKEPYSITGTINKGDTSRGASMKTLLPPWVVKLLSGNMTFWRATQEEIDLALEGRRLTRQKNQLRAEQLERERQQMRGRQADDEKLGVVREGILLPERKNTMPAATVNYAEDDDSEEGESKRRSEGMA